MLALLGFYFVYFQWFKTNREKKIHILKILKAQLDCLGPWVGSTGSGYGSELTKLQKFDNINPFKLIFNTGSSPLIDSTLLEQVSEVPEEIIGEINQLFYDFKRIESIQNFRNQLVASDVKLSTAIKEKIENCKIETTTFEDFLDKLTENERSFVSILLTYGQFLHCNIIGNKHHGARQHWEKVYQWVIEEIKQYRKPQFVFIVLTFIIFSLTLFTINSNWKFATDNLSIILLSFLFTLLTSIRSRALIINNQK